MHKTTVCIDENETKLFLKLEGFEPLTGANGARLAAVGAPTGAEEFVEFVGGVEVASSSRRQVSRRSSRRRAKRSRRRRTPDWRTMSRQVE